MKVTMVTIIDGGKADDVYITLYKSDRDAWSSLWDEFIDRDEELPLEDKEKFLSLSQEEKVSRWDREVGVDMSMIEESVFGE